MLNTRIREGCVSLYHDMYNRHVLYHLPHTISPVDRHPDLELPLYEIREPPFLFEQRAKAETPFPKSLLTYFKFLGGVREKSWLRRSI